MKKISLLALDAIRKEELLTMKGGADNGGGGDQKCPCICVGPLQPGDGDSDSDDDSDSDGPTTSDRDCTDCGFSNAFRVKNP